MMEPEIMTDDTKLKTDIDSLRRENQALRAELNLFQQRCEQPLYHLEQQLRDRYGVDCSRQTMARWLIDLMEPLQPIFNLLKDYIIDYDVASCDATTLQVLNEPGREPQVKSYVYCMRGGSPE